MQAASSDPNQLLPELADLIAARAKKSDESRSPDPEVIRSLGDLGLMKLLVPVEYGGLELHPAGLIDFTDSLAQIHGSTAWVAMTLSLIHI